MDNRGRNEDTLFPSTNNRVVCMDYKVSQFRQTFGIKKSTYFDSNSHAGHLHRQYNHSMNTESMAEHTIP